MPYTTGGARMPQYSPTRFRDMYSTGTVPPGSIQRGVGGIGVEPRDMSPQRHIRGGVRADDVVYSGSVVRTPTDPRGVKGAAKLLLIGVTYRGDYTLQLPAAAHELRTMQQYLTRAGFTPKDRRILVEDDPSNLPTRANILSALRWLVRGAVSGDALFLHYAGQSGPSDDTMHDLYDTNRLLDTSVESLVPLDYKLSGFIYSEEIHDILAASLPAGVKLTVILDCPRVGSLIDLPYRIVQRTDDSLVTTESSPNPNPKPCPHHDIPASVQVVTYGGEAAGIGAGSLTTAFISACNATPLLTFRQLILDMGYIMSREARYSGTRGADGEMICPRPMLSSSRPFEMTDLFSLSSEGVSGTPHGAPLAALPGPPFSPATPRHGVSGFPEPLQSVTSPREVELERRIQYLESKLTSKRGGGPPALSTPAAAYSPEAKNRSPVRRRTAGGGGAAEGPFRPYGQKDGAFPGSGEEEEEVSGASKAVFITCEYLGSPFEVQAREEGSQPDGSAKPPPESRMQDFLMHVGFNAKVQVLTERSKAHHFIPYRSNVIAALKWLVKDVSPGDVLFLYYSGFSSVPVQNEPADGGVELPENGFSDVIHEAIAPTDFFESGFITGDEIVSILLPRIPHGAKLVVVADVCFSKGMGKQPTPGTIMRLPHVVSVNQSAGGVMHYYDREVEFALQGSSGGEVTVISAHHPEAKKGLLTECLLGVWGNSAQICIGLLVSALHSQLLLRVPSRVASAFIQSTERRHDKDLVYLGNRPQRLKQILPPRKENAKIAPGRDGASELHSGAKSDSPAGVYLIADDPKRPAAVIADESTPDAYTLFSVETGEMKGTTSEPQQHPGAPVKLSVAPQGSIEGEVASPPPPVGSPSEAGSPESPPPPSPSPSPERGGAGGAQGATYDPQSGVITFDDGTVWVKKHEGGAGGKGSKEEGSGKEVTPHRRRFAHRVVIGATKALLAGVAYPNSGYTLPSPHDDVRTMQRFLHRQGFNAETRCLLDVPEGYPSTPGPFTAAMSTMPTRVSFLSNLRWLCSGAVPGDSLFLFFSGHGDAGESLVPCDVNVSGVIPSEEIYALISRLPEQTKLTIVLDLGTGGPVLNQLPYVMEGHPNGGFATRERRAPDSSQSALPELNVFYVRDAGGAPFTAANNLHGALSAAFMSVANRVSEESGADPTFESLLTAMKDIIDRRISDAGGQPASCAVGVASTRRLSHNTLFSLGNQSAAAGTPLHSPFGRRPAGGPANPFAAGGGGGGAGSLCKRAVVVSCSYGGKLPNSNSVVSDFQGTLQAMGFPAESVKVLTEAHSNAVPTKENIIAFMQWLVHGCEPGDDLVFCFVGLGARTGDGDSVPLGSPPGIAPADYHIAGLITPAELQANLIAPLVSGVSLFCVFDGAYTCTPMALPYGVQLESDGAMSYSRYHNPRLNSQGLVQCLATSMDTSNPRLVACNGLLGRSFLATMRSFTGASQRLPRIGHFLQSLHNAMEGAARGSGHLPAFSSTQQFGENDSLYLLLNDQAGAEGGGSPQRAGLLGGMPEAVNVVHPPRAPLPAEEYGRGTPVGTPAGAPHNHPNVSPVRAGRGGGGGGGVPVAGHHPGGVNFPVLYTGNREIDENMTGIQKALSDALAMAKNRSRSPVSPGTVIGQAVPNFADPRSPIAPTVSHVLRLRYPDEPLGMRLNPLPTGQEVGAHGGMAVAAVTSGSPAYAAGIVPGDVVLRIASYPIRRSQDVRTARGFAQSSGSLEIGVELSAAALH